MKIDKQGSKKNKKATGLTALLLAGVMAFSTIGLTACDKKEDKDDNNTSISYQKEEGIVSAIKAELKGIAPSMSDEKLQDVALIIALDLIAQKNENGKIRSDIMDYFKNKVDSDSMMDNFNSFEDVVENTIITENKYLSAASTLPEALKDNKQILSCIEKISFDVQKASLKGDKATVNSEFKKIYTLFVDEDKLTVDGLEFEVRDLDYSIRSIAEIYARSAAYYARGIFNKEKLEKIDARTNQQNNKAYIKETLDIMANNIDEVSDTDVLGEFESKYTAFDNLLDGKVNTSLGNEKDLVNYVNLKYLESTHVSTKDKNSILNEYEEGQVNDTILTIDAITKYNYQNQNEMILFSNLIVKDYLETDTGKTDKLALDFIQFNSMMLLNEKNSIKTFEDIFNNPYFRNLYLYFTRQDMVYKHNANGEVVDDKIVWQEISDGSNFVIDEIILYTLKEFKNLQKDFEVYGFTKQCETNLTNSVQYVENVLTGECQKTDAKQYVK